MRVAIFAQKYKLEHQPYIDRLVAKLNELSLEHVFYSDYSVQQGMGETGFTDHDSLVAFKPDLFITLGGDGTMLNAASVIRELETPILGINLGRLGFLASTEKNQIEKALDVWSVNGHRIEERTMLSLHCSIPIFGDKPLALNDFTITKRDTSSMIKVHTYINDEFLNSYWADGLILCTPTGSTGYSLSCGGPIIFPDSGNFAITPVAPHNLNVRPIVISDDSEIRFNIEGRSENFLCTLDSRYETITSEHEITIKKSKLKTRLVLPEKISFMNTIRQKLSWGFDTRNV